VLSNIAIIFHETKSLLGAFNVTTINEVGMPVDRRDKSESYLIEEKSGDIFELLDIAMDNCFAIADVLRAVALTKLSTPVLITDRRGLIVSTNASFTLVFGFRSSDIEGKTIDVLSGAESDKHSILLLDPSISVTSSDLHWPDEEDDSLMEVSVVLYDKSGKKLNCEISVAQVQASSFPGSNEFEGSDGNALYSHRDWYRLIAIHDFRYDGSGAEAKSRMADHSSSASVASVGSEINVDSVCIDVFDEDAPVTPSPDQGRSDQEDSVIRFPATVPATHTTTALPFPALPYSYPTMRMTIEEATAAAYAVFPEYQSSTEEIATASSR
jgi:PAS domain-containing protein